MSANEIDDLRISGQNITLFTLTETDLAEMRGRTDLEPIVISLKVYIADDIGAQRKGAEVGHQWKFSRTAATARR